MIVDHRYSDAGSIRGCVSSPMYSNLLNSVTLPRELSVVDIGSNVGGFPLLLHALGFEIKRLTCVEFNPNTFVRLHFNILSNWPKATVLNRAIASEASKVTVRLGQGSTGDSLRRGSPDRGGELVEIQKMRLDDLPDNDTIDILKMDIEHAEVDVLLNPGHEATLARTQVLVIEIHPLAYAQAIHDAIAAAGLTHVAGSRNLIGQHIFAR